MQNATECFRLVNLDWLRQEQCVKNPGAIIWGLLSVVNFVANCLFILLVDPAFVYIRPILIIRTPFSHGRKVVILIKWTKQKFNVFESQNLKN